MRRAVALSLTLVVALGCERRSVTSPKPPGISADILDGAHGNGNPNFFFLPPLVAQPSFSGTLNPNLGPVVKICTLAVTTTGTACDPTVALIDPGPMLFQTDHYQVDWNTGATNVSTSSTYRIQVFAANQLLGFADVQPVSNGSALKNLKTGDIIGLVDGRTLPIKVRIESGALCFGQLDCGEGTVGPGGGTIVTHNTFAGVLFPPGALSNTVTVLIAQNTSQPCLPIDLFQAAGSCYDFVTSPPGQFLTNVTVAICVDVEEFGGFPTTHKPWFLLHQLDFVENQPVVRSLPNASAAFLPCNATEHASLAPGTHGIDRWLALAKAGSRALLGFLTPRQLYAFHLGVGGGTCCFSRIGWAIPSIMSQNEGNGQTAVSGTAVAVPPAVVLRDSGGSPIAGETVTFSVASGGGSITGATQVTNSDGVATVGSWTLGTTDGINTLTATSLGAANSPQTFTATGTTITALATDPTGDATTDNRITGPSPDLVSGAATAGGGNLTMSVGFATGTFSSTNTLVELLLDTDRNPATGSPGSDAGGVNDRGLIGVDFLVVLGSGNGSQADILQFAGTPNTFTHVGFAPVTFTANGADVTIPLTLLGNSNGQMNFKVTAAAALPTGGFTGVLDYMTNVGTAPTALVIPPPIL